MIRPRHARAAGRAGCSGEEDEQQQHDDAVLRVALDGERLARRQEGEHHVVAVERRDRQQVEEREQDVEAARSSTIELAGRSPRPTPARSSTRKTTAKHDGHDDVGDRSGGGHDRQSRARPPRSAAGLTSTGFAQPKPATSRRSAPIGSMCGIGLRVTRPIARGRWSPSWSATKRVAELVEGQADQQRDRRPRPAARGTAFAEEHLAPGAAGGRRAASRAARRRCGPSR